MNISAVPTAVLPAMSVCDTPHLIPLGTRSILLVIVRSHQQRCCRQYIVYSTAAVTANIHPIKIPIDDEYTKQEKINGDVRPTKNQILNFSKHLPYSKKSMQVAHIIQRISSHAVLDYCRCCCKSPPQLPHT